MNKYAAGFKSLEREAEINELEIDGNIPKWIKGSLIRTAPSKFETDKQNLNHWFDGFAMLHQFDFEEGQVSYKNKFVQSNAYQHYRKNGKIKFSEFATDPCQSFLGKVMSFFTSPKATDNPNVNTGKIGDELVSMTETPMPIIFDKETLETKGHFEYDDDLDGMLTVAHPHFNTDGTLYSYLLEFGYESKYHVYHLPKGGSKRELIVSIPSKNPAYVHSFGMTENYIILAESAFVVNPLKLKLSGKPLIANYKWKPENGTRFHVIDKNKKEHIITVVGEPIFCFHHVNAFEEAGNIIVDLIAYKDAQVINQLYLKNLRTKEQNPTGKLCRFRLNVEEETIEKKQLSDAGMELPRIDYKKYNGKPYPRLYAAANKIPGNFYDALITRSMESGDELWWAEQDCYPGEPVYLPNPEGLEDEGVILSVVFNAATEKSFLLILDAQTFKEIGRAKLPQHIPFGFHGNFFD